MKIPFQYAKNHALIPNLQDKLISPINHGFSKKELEKILATLKFQHYKVKELLQNVCSYDKIDYKSYFYDKGKVFLLQRTNTAIY